MQWYKNIKLSQWFGSSQSVSTWGLVFHSTAEEDNPCQPESGLELLTSGIKQIWAWQHCVLNRSTDRKHSFGTGVIMAGIQHLIYVNLGHFSQESEHFKPMGHTKCRILLNRRSESKTNTRTTLQCWNVVQKHKTTLQKVLWRDRGKVIVSDGNTMVPQRLLCLYTMVYTFSTYWFSGS